MNFKWLILLHVLGACVWVGGHLLVAIRYVPEALKKRDPGIILGFEKKYEIIGMPALLLQVITGILMGLKYEGIFFNFNTHFATVFNLKLIVLLLTVLLAIDARLFIIPKLNDKNLNLLAYHIIAVTFLGLVFVYLGISFTFGF